MIVKKGLDFLLCLLQEEDLTALLTKLTEIIVNNPPQKSGQHSELA
jgi:hypothetical protein